MAHATSSVEKYMHCTAAICLLQAVLPWGCSVPCLHAYRDTSVLPTVRSLASLLYVNIKYCHSEVIFQSRFVWPKGLQTSSSRKRHGTIQKTELKYLAWTTKKQSFLGQASSYVVHGDSQPSASPHWKRWLRQVGGIAFLGKIGTRSAGWN